MAGTTTTTVISASVGLQGEQDDGDHDHGEGLHDEVHQAVLEQLLSASMSLVIRVMTRPAFSSV